MTIYTFQGPFWDGFGDGWGSLQSGVGTQKEARELSPRALGIFDIVFDRGSLQVVTCLSELL